MVFSPVGTSRCSLLSAFCSLLSAFCTALCIFQYTLTVHGLSHLLPHLATASEHLAAVVLLVLLLPDQGEVQVHVLCHLHHQGQAGMLKTTLC